MATKKFSAIRELVALVAGHRLALGIVLVCLVLLTCLNMARPKLMGFVIDRVFLEDQGGPVRLLLKKPVDVPRALNRISVDGDPKEWTDVAPLPAPYEGLDAGSVRLAWTEEGLFGLVTARDSEVVANPSRPWEADSLELFVEKDAAQQAHRTDNTSQYVFIPNAASEKRKGRGFVPYGRDEEIYRPSELCSAWRKTEEGYTLEFRVPARLLYPARMLHGTLLGLNYALNDGGKAVEQFYSDKNSGEGYRVPKTWGLIRLTRPPGELGAGTVDEPVEIPELTGSIDIDGDLADWEGIEPLPAPYQGLRRSSVHMAWNEAALWGAVAVRDSALSVDPTQPWQGDCFELFVEKDAAREPYRTDSTTQYAFAPDLDSPNGECYVVVPYGRDEEIYGPSGIAALWQRTEEGYALEFMIPAALLQPATMAGGTKLGLNFAISDDGEPVEQFYSDKNKDDGYRTPRSWGRVVFRKHLSVMLPGEARLKLLMVVLVILALIYVLRNFLFYRSKRSVVRMGEYVALDLRQRLLRHLHTLSVDFYQQHKPGKLSARVMLDVQAIQQFIQDELANLVLNVLMVAVAALIMFSMDWFLALVTLAIMPLHVVVYWLFRRPIRTYARRAKEHAADVSGNLIEQFGGAPIVKSSVTEELEEERFSQAMRKGMRAQLTQSKYYLLQKVAADLLVGLGTIVLFGVGGYSVLYRGMTPGDFVAFYVYIGLLYPRLLELVSQAGKFARTAASVERVFEMMSLVPNVRERPGAIDHTIASGRIEFRGVSFAYGEQKVLDDVSLTIEGGDQVLVLGPSGAGKTTFFSLIPRFYDIQKGAILIDGMDVRDFTLASLRQQVGVVFQDCFLFNDTIMANVRYARPSASDEAVIEACRKAFADEFVERLPNGYMTIVGEGGTQLSQGEKRRLMIARAILKDPKILILDEPLVSLDAYAKQRAVEGLSALLGNRTILAVTHSPEDLPAADREIYVGEGKAIVTKAPGGALKSV